MKTVNKRVKLRFPSSLSVAILETFRKQLSTPVPIPGVIPPAQVQAEGRVCSLLTKCLCGLVGFPSWRKRGWDPGSGGSGEPHRRSLWLQPLPVLSSCTCSSPNFTFLLPVQRLCLTSAVPRELSGTDLVTGAGTVPSQHPCGVGTIPCLLLPQPSPCPHGGCALAVPKLCQGPLELSMDGAPAPGNISQLCFIHRSR